MRIGLCFVFHENRTAQGQQRGHHRGRGLNEKLPETRPALGQARGAAALAQARPDLFDALGEVMQDFGIHPLSRLNWDASPWVNDNDCRLSRVIPCFWTLTPQASGAHETDQPHPPPANR